MVNKNIKYHENNQNISKSAVSPKNLQLQPKPPIKYQPTQPPIKRVPISQRSIKKPFAPRPPPPRHTQQLHPQVKPANQLIPQSLPAYSPQINSLYSWNPAPIQIPSLDNQFQFVSSNDGFIPNEINELEERARIAYKNKQCILSHSLNMPSVCYSLCASVRTYLKQPQITKSNTTQTLLKSKTITQKQPVFC